MAYQAKVPRDLRKYIEHWAKEKEADTYTRQHSTIVKRIWDEVWKNYEEASQTARGDLPHELEHPEFMGEDNADTAQKGPELNERPDAANPQGKRQRIGGPASPPTP